MFDVITLCRPRRLLAVLALSCVCAAQAAASSAEGGRLYASCVVCHRSNAWGSSDGAVPSLAGQQKPYLERQLTVFTAGARMDIATQNGAVHSTVRTPHDLGVLSGYLAELTPNPQPLTGPGEHLRVGQEAFTHICAACHGADGRGESLNRVPRIAGQQYPYLRRQIEAAATLHKDFAPPEMTSALRGMGTQEKDALADYISRLSNADSLLDSSRPDDTSR